ncbi:MAG: DUF5615 family PIN-like protein [Bryobacteraceae bacterium]
MTTALRLRSIDVLTAQDDRATQCDDDRLLQRATELGRVLVSQDEDLLREGVRRLREGEAFSGVVYTHQLRVTIGQMVEDLELIALATFQGGLVWQDSIFANRMKIRANCGVGTETLVRQLCGDPVELRSGRR